MALAIWVSNISYKISYSTQRNIMKLETHNITSERGVAVKNLFKRSIEVRIRSLIFTSIIPETDKLLHSFRIVNRIFYCQIYLILKSAFNSEFKNLKNLRGEILQKHFKLISKLLKFERFIRV